MLKLLRKKGVQKKLLWVVAIVIIISFGFFGTAYLLDDTVGNYAGKIFGRTITLDKFTKARQQKNVQAILLYGDQYRKIAPFLDLDAQTWDQLILLHETSKRKINVTDQEVVETIENYPFFQRDGQFDSLLYNDILMSYFRMKARDFEEGTRSAIMINKLFEQVTLPISISDEEIFEAYKKANERIQVHYILFTADDYRQTENFDPNLMSQYYNDHKSEFLAPPSINVEYITLKFSEDPDGPEAEEKEKLMAKADEIYEILFDEEDDFAGVAKKNNLSVETSGFFSREQPLLTIGWPFELFQKSFELEEDDVSDPIETAKGIYILRLKEKRESYIPEFEDVKDKITEALEIDSAQKTAHQKAQQALEELQTKTLSADGNFDFKIFAESVGLKVQETTPFQRGDYLPTIGISREFQETAFALSDQNTVSDSVVKTAKGYCILQFESYLPVDEEQFKAEKGALTQQLTAKKKNDTFNDFQTRLRLKARLVDNITPIREQQTQN